MTSFDYTGFCDLDLPCDPGDTSADLLPRIKRALDLGYEIIALNVSVHQDNLATSKVKPSKAKKAKTEEKELISDFPAPPKVDLDPSLYPALAAKNRRPKVLKRLTLTLKDNNFLPIFNRSETVSEYDLIAINPVSVVALQNLLKTGFRADIVTFDPENVRDFRWSRKLYMECVEKSMYFEVNYSPAIRDSTTRRRIITQAHNYHSVSFGVRDS